MSSNPAIDEVEMESPRLPVPLPIAGYAGYVIDDGELLSYQSIK